MSYYLPTELWHQVFSNVSAVDLCSLVQTSKSMNSIGSCPDLWARMRVNTQKVRQSGLATLFSIHRFKKVQSIDLRNAEFVLGDLIHLLEEITVSPLQNISFAHVDLSGVSADLLVTVVSNLVEVNLRRSNLTIQQCTGVLESILTSTTLKTVDLVTVDLRQIPSSLLANAVRRLQTVSLSNVNNDQIVEVLQARVTSTTLKSLDLSGVNLSGVPDQLLAQAFSIQKRVDLFSTRLTTGQCTHLLKASIITATITHLNLSFVYLTSVPPNLLAKAIYRLVCLKMNFNELTRVQEMKVVKACIKSKTLIDVDLTGNGLGVGLPADLIASLPAHVRI